ncbi:hypothetical protein Q5H92_21740 [Hymenobacter sp. M29]|uniref:Uncharacterized protein n=1 Tax=Hymenobacter mellowenesis TaxID=3063995 RepID=A0ABT9AI12_9BACT|nr:hypothetical protein [Hymenobacter sp. M29]MDO7849002.1 hypothetical protein [Hymenobacter sp. M29]
MTFAALLDTLASFGRRHRQIGRAALTGTGEAPANSVYPLLLVEADPLCEGMTLGIDSYSIALQVLDRERDQYGEFRADAEDVPAMLTRTKDWADQIIQQLRDENPGWIDGNPSFLGLPQCAGTDLATGWRIEMRLKVPRELNRVTNAAFFDAAAPAPAEARPLNDFSPADIIAQYLRLTELRELLAPSL